MDTISELVGATRKAAVLGKRLREWRESLGTGTPDEAKDDIKKIKRYQRQLCTTMVTLGVETSDEETDFDITDVGRCQNFSILSTFSLTTTQSRTMLLANRSRERRGALLGEKRSKRCAIS